MGPEPRIRVSALLRWGDRILLCRHEKGGRDYWLLPGGGVDGGLDMTRRDVPGAAKKMGRPWEVGKACDEAAPCSALGPASVVGHPAKGSIWLKVNGQVRQTGDLAQQIWNVQEQIAYLSGLVTLRPGDLIYTGTPAGVGPVKPGDKLEAHVDGVGDLTITYR